MSILTASKKHNRTANIVFTEGTLWDKLLRFVLPVAAASIIQQLFHSADMAVVGRFVGKEALAAVGGTTPLVNLFLEFFVGLSNAANVVTARFIGQNDRKRAGEAVHTAITVALISGILVGAAGIGLSGPLLRLMLVPADIIERSAEYLMIYFAGMPFLMLNNFAAAIFRSCGNTKKPLYCLSAGGMLNVALNLVFVLVLKNGIAGVAWATVISNGCSAVLLLFLLTREEETIRLHPRRLGIRREILAMLLKIGVPAGFLGSVFSISNVCTQSAVNSLGTDTVSASSAAVNVEIYLQFIGNAFAQATTTAVSQNVGAKQPARCTQVTRTAIGMCVGITAVFSALTFLFGRNLLALFVSDAAVIGIAMIRMRYTVIFKFVQGMMDILSGALQGYGYTLVPALISVFGVCGVRLLWIFTVFLQNRTLGTLMMIYPITQGIAVIVYAVLVYRCAGKAADSMNRGGG